MHRNIPMLRGEHRYMSSPIIGPMSIINAAHESGWYWSGSRKRYFVETDADGNERRIEWGRAHTIPNSDLRVYELTEPVSATPAYLRRVVPAGDWIRVVAVNASGVVFDGEARSYWERATGFSLRGMPWFVAGDSGSGTFIKRFGNRYELIGIRQTPIGDIGVCGYVDQILDVHDKWGIPMPVVSDNFHPADIDGDGKATSSDLAMMVRMVMRGEVPMADLLRWVHVFTSRQKAHIEGNG